MNIKKLPVAFLVGGLVIKTLLVLLWRQWGSGGLLSLLIDYDPGARYFAERMTRLFFTTGGSLSRRDRIRSSTSPWSQASASSASWQAFCSGGC